MRRQSKLMDRMPPSTTTQVFEAARRLEAQGIKLAHLDIGEPDFNTPQHIVEAAYREMLRGQTHYTSTRGLPQLCEAIARHEAEFGIQADPAKNILVTPGSKFAIYAFLISVLDPGDEAVIISPVWPSYTSIMKAAGAKPVYVKTDNSFHIDGEELSKAVTSRTRLIMVNSPNNPTGGVFDRSDLNLIRDVAVDNDLLVMSDEIYKMILYDGTRHLSIASLPDMAERTVVIDGFSKTYAMTGWRIGYAVGDEKIIQNMVKVMQNTVTCVASFIQLAAVEALNGPQDSVRKMVQEYNTRRNIILRMIREIP
ncbi:MAG: pyridoxal phosphate-dependent aminotransferase, partial [Candidatus Bathyarchaeia archaeon]